MKCRVRLWLTRVFFVFLFFLYPLYPCRVVWMNLALFASPNLCDSCKISSFFSCYAVGLHTLVYVLAEFLPWDVNRIPAGELSSGKELQSISPKLGLDHRQFCKLRCNYNINVVTYVWIWSAKPKTSTVANSVCFFCLFFFFPSRVMRTLLN